MHLLQGPSSITSKPHHMQWSQPFTALLGRTLPYTTPTTSQTRFPTPLSPTQAAHYPQPPSQGPLRHFHRQPPKRPGRARRPPCRRPRRCTPAPKRPQPLPAAAGPRRPTPHGRRLRGAPRGRVRRSPWGGLWGPSRGWVRSPTPSRPAATAAARATSRRRLQRRFRRARWRLRGAPGGWHLWGPQACRSPGGWVWGSPHGGWRRQRGWGAYRARG